MFRKMLALVLLALAVQAYATEEMNIVPSEAVKDEVHKAQGGSPEQYRQVDESLDEYDRAEQFDPLIKPKTNNFPLTLNKLKVETEVHISEGYVTTITFLDVRGRPYPARVSRIGDKDTFKVCAGINDNCKIDESSMDIAHILTVGTDRLAGRSNLKVFFKGLDKAVHIPLVVKEKSYHSEITVMLPVENPNAESALPTFAQNNRVMNQTDDLFARALLDSIPLDQMPGAKRLKLQIENAVGQKFPDPGAVAVYANGATYLKSRIRLPNPTPDAVTPGYHGYSVMRFDGKPRAVSGFNGTGEVVIALMKQPKNMAGFRQ